MKALQIISEPEKCRNEEGNAILGVMILIFVTTLILGTLASTSIQQMLILRKDTARTHALAIADAGVNKAFAVLAENPALANANDVILSENFSDGEYDVSVQQLMDDVILVTAEALYNGENVSAAATINIEAPEEEPPDKVGGPVGPIMLLAGNSLKMSGGADAELGTFTAHSNGDFSLSDGPSINAAGISAYGGLTLNGNPQVVLDGGSGSLHANGAVTLIGDIVAGEITSSTSIQGDWGTSVSATNIAPVVNWPRGFNPKPPIEERAVDEVNEIPLPELDVDAFQALAESNDWYYEGNVNITRSWLTKDIKDRTGENVHNNETLVHPEGDVMFVDGDVQIASDMEFEGVVVATGNIKIVGAASFENPTDYPAMVSVNGDIHIGGGATGATANGWVYAMDGDVDATGGASGAGIVASGDITISGGYEVGDFDGTPVVSPGGSGGGGSGGGNEGNTADVQVLSWTK